MNIVLYALVGVIAMLGFQQLKPTDAQIKKCQEASGYSAERCEWELTR